MLDNFIAQIRNNPRLRWGLWLIFGIFWLYAVLLLRDQFRDKSEQYANAVKKVERLQAEVRQKEWLERVEEARALKVQMESRLWQADSSGLAQASFQDWLNQMFLQAAIGRPSMTLSAVEDKGSGMTDAEKKETVIPEDLWKIKAKLEFDFNPATFLSLMTQMVSHEKKTVFESLVIRKEPVPRVEAVVVAYFQKQKTPGSASLK